MKICYIADAILPSQTANSIHVMNMCQAYAFLGHQVKLIVPDRIGNDNKRHSNEEIFNFYGVEKSFVLEKIWLPYIRSSWVYFCLFLPFFAWLFRPKFVHTRNIGVAWGCAKFFRMDTVFELHNDPFDDPVVARFFRRFINLRSCRAVVVITESLRRYVLENTPVDKPIFVLPDGVSSQQLSLGQSKMEARNRLGLRIDLKIGLYAGSLYEGRGIEIIILLASKFPSYDFYIIGGNQMQIEGFRSKLMTVPTGNIHFVGFIEPRIIPFYLLASDILLMPYASVVKVAGGSETSRFASPMKMFEYMAAERPILSSALPVLSEILTDHHDALMIAFDQPEAWVKAFASLDENPGEGDRLARNAKVKVREFTWERRAQKIIDSLFNTQII